MIFGNFSLWTPKGAALFGVGPLMLASLSAMVPIPCPFSETAHSGSEKSKNILENMNSCTDGTPTERWLGSHAPRGEAAERRTWVWGQDDGQLPRPGRMNSVVVALWGDGTAVAVGGRTPGTGRAPVAEHGGRPDWGAEEIGSLEATIPTARWPDGGAVGDSFAPGVSGPAVAVLPATNTEGVGERL